MQDVLRVQRGEPLGQIVQDGASAGLGQRHVQPGQEVLQVAAAGQFQANQSVDSTTRFSSHGPSNTTRFSSHGPSNTTRFSSHGPSNTTHLFHTDQATRHSSVYTDQAARHGSVHTDQPWVQSVDNTTRFSSYRPSNMTHYFTRTKHGFSLWTI